jgi:hypothetical protein
MLRLDLGISIPFYPIHNIVSLDWTLSTEDKYADSGTVEWYTITPDDFLFKGIEKVKCNSHAWVPLGDASNSSEVQVIVLLPFRSPHPLPKPA